MQNIRKIFRAVSEKTTLPTNQLLATPPILYDLADAGPTTSEHLLTIKKLKLPNKIYIT